MNTWGHILTLSIFGESHGPAIGAVIGGLPPGIALDEDQIAREMARRAPGQGDYATARREADVVRILSGVKDGRTTGAPLAGIIENTSQHSGDYPPMIRPGHADMAAMLKYQGFADMRGGGHFSGRLTAPLVFAGAIAKQLLSAAYRTEIYGRIQALAGKTDGLVLTELPTQTDDPQVLASWTALKTIAAKPFPAADNVERQFLDAVAAAKADGDSVGGVVEVAATMPGELGEPFFGSVESRLAELLFSIPAVKGVEFGSGFALSAMRGSAANDPLRVVEGKGLVAMSNHCGGILGGISTGAPLICRAAFKPTPSIARPQQSVDPTTGENCDLAVKGRHDPCIVPRAVPVVEACVALGLLDLAFEAARYLPWEEQAA
jgi:chorismate synthase